MGDRNESEWSGIDVGQARCANGMDLARVREDDDGNGADKIDVKYAYTPDSRLAWRYDHIAGERVEFVYWGGKVVREIREDAAGSHTVLWEHVWLGSRLVRSHEAPTGKTYHLHHDRLRPEEGGRE